LNISYAEEEKIYCVSILILKSSVQHETVIRHNQQFSFVKRPPCLMGVSICHHDTCQSSTLKSANFISKVVRSFNPAKPSVLA